MKPRHVDISPHGHLPEICHEKTAHSSLTCVISTLLDRLTSHYVPVQVLIRSPTGSFCSNTIARNANGYHH